MISKKEVINNLRKVKLVIGNGFDLYCQLKTSYSDYFQHDKDKNEYFYKWIRDFSFVAKDYINFKTINNKEFRLDFKNFDKTNVWDFYFYLISKEEDVEIKKWRWCDIESKIEESLSDENTKNNLQWVSIFNLLSASNIIQKKLEDKDLLVLVGIVYKKHRESKFSSKDEFYSFLLDELKLFEKNFGIYIYKQHFNDSYKEFGIIETNGNFRFIAKRAIENLCNPENLVSIDSFNYDSIEVRELDNIFHNINGTLEAPIFGIDTNKFSCTDPRYIFSKTNRRMELDMLENEVFQEIQFENIIIFGHSLNEADYSYFFSIFDKINITNLDNQSKVIFAYTIYDSKKESTIKANLRKAVFKLFKDYAEYKGNKEYPNRLIDILTIHNKILMYQIKRYED